MALPIPLGLRSSFGIKIDNRPSSSTRPEIAIKASLKEHKRKGTGNLPYSSPLQRTEEIASAFGLQLTVLELERLFQEAADPLRPNLSGPYTPSPPSGFSGRPMRVAYQGVRGSYCQEAAVKAFSSICNAFPCNQMEDAFDALEDKAADCAIIPVENSIDGTIDRNLDLLLRHDHVKIVGELILPVNHCLLAVPGTSRSDLRRIVSHPQALSHCKTKLESLDLEVDEVSNAADAARFVSENRISNTAVIGSRIAAKEFGLQVLEQNFQDRVGNFNRFAQLGLEPSPVRKENYSCRAWKTTIAFSLENGVSDLFRALWVFESQNIPVTRVEHRPNRSSPVKVVGKHRYFDYVFILDLEGSVCDSGVKTALSQLEEISPFLRVLGSYTCGLVA
ncbi:hypothetical protein HHK36_026228 [Tetracentron sinense]|uniref:Prephenate dehydratase domain-containing protein n=1 Tax=Tetracentron sinense TaxID=13715 RepID=A0A835D594_TETSI|nr:hypothetical protein HHK36_033106 [Tetracentron sinense]KAF8387574.1 hypothetical protein HHK36_026228 [Tetracentron sinense]